MVALSLIALSDGQHDMSSKLIVTVFSLLAELERDLISMRISVIPPRYSHLSHSRKDKFAPMYAIASDEESLVDLHIQDIDGHEHGLSARAPIRIGGHDSAAGGDDQATELLVVSRVVR